MKYDNKKNKYVVDAQKLIGATKEEIERAHEEVARRNEALREKYKTPPTPASSRTYDATGQTNIEDLAKTTQTPIQYLLGTLGGTIPENEQTRINKEIERTQRQQLRALGDTKAAEDETLTISQRRNRIIRLAAQAEEAWIQSEKNRLEIEESIKTRPETVKINGKSIIQEIVLPTPGTPEASNRQEKIDQIWADINKLEDDGAEVLVQVDTKEGIITGINYTVVKVPPGRALVKNEHGGLEVARKTFPIEQGVEVSEQTQSMLSVNPIFRDLQLKFIDRYSERAGEASDTYLTLNTDIQETGTSKLFVQAPAQVASFIEAGAGFVDTLQPLNLGVLGSLTQGAMGATLRYPETVESSTVALWTAIRDPELAMVSMAVGGFVAGKYIQEHPLEVSVSFIGGLAAVAAINALDVKAGESLKSAFEPKKTVEILRSQVFHSDYLKGSGDKGPIQYSTGKIVTEGRGVETNLFGMSREFTAKAAGSYQTQTLLDVPGDEVASFMTDGLQTFEIKTRTPSAIEKITGLPIGGKQTIMMPGMQSKFGQFGYIYNADLPDEAFVNAIGVTPTSAGKVTTKLIGETSQLNFVTDSKIWGEQPASVDFGTPMYLYESRSGIFGQSGLQLSKGVATVRLDLPSMDLTAGESSAGGIGQVLKSGGPSPVVGQIISQQQSSVLTALDNAMVTVSGGAQNVITGQLPTTVATSSIFSNVKSIQAAPPQMEAFGLKTVTSQPSQIEGVKIGFLGSSGGQAQIIPERVAFLASSKSKSAGVGLIPDFKIGQMSKSESEGGFPFISSKPILKTSEKSAIPEPTILPPILFPLQESTQRRVQTITPLQMSGFDFGFKTIQGILPMQGQIFDFPGITPFKEVPGNIPGPPGPGSIIPPPPPGGGLGFGANRMDFGFKTFGSSRPGYSTTKITPSLFGVVSRKRRKKGKKQKSLFSGFEVRGL